MGRGYRNWAAAPAAFEERGGSPSSSSSKGASVNVLSLGFAATAILLSLFLLMALFERFLRPGAALSSATAAPAPASAPTSSKLHAPPLPPSDPFTGVSVLMPGHSFPTFIANPLPLPLSLHPHPHPPTHAAMQPGSIISQTSSALCNKYCPTHHLQLSI